MSRLFFHVRDRFGLCVDEEGMIVDDKAAAHAIAIAAARSLIMDDVSQGLRDLGGAVEVTDCQGAPVLTLPFAEALDRISV